MKKSVSLNEAVRRAERDEFDAKRKARADKRVELGIALDPLLQPRSDDGLQDSERNVVQDAARDVAAKKRHRSVAARIRGHPGRCDRAARRGCQVVGAGVAGSPQCRSLGGLRQRARVT